MASKLTNYFIIFSRRRGHQIPKLVGFSRCLSCKQNAVGIGQLEKLHWKNVGREDSGNDGKLWTLLTAFCLFLCGFLGEKFQFGWRLFPTVCAIGKDENSLRKRFNFVANVVEQCEDAVVCIESVVHRFGGQSVIPRGAGFIIKEDGLILTNAHVVMNKPLSLQVKLKDGRIYQGRIEDMDMETDLATIRINANQLPVMKLGSSDDLRAGEWVIAIGNPFSLTHSVSTGVVSAPQRKGEDLGLGYKGIYYIQTDATTTFGNSGGPLVNLDGEVVGVNSMKVVTGISFAIPIEFVKKFLEANEEQRRRQGDPNVVPSTNKRGYLGIVMLTLSNSLFNELSYKQYKMPDFLVNSIMICEIATNSPAYRGGLQPGDIISEINGQKVDGVKSLYDALRSEKPLNLKIFRRDIFFDVTLVPDPIG